PQQGAQAANRGARGEGIGAGEGMRGEQDAVAGEGAEPKLPAALAVEGAAESSPGRGRGADVDDRHPGVHQHGGVVDAQRVHLAGEAGGAVTAVARDRDSQKAAVVPLLRAAEGGAGPGPWAGTHGRSGREAEQVEDRRLRWRTGLARGGWRA